MNTLHGRCMAKHWKQRDEFEKMFLRVYKDLEKAAEIEKAVKNHPLVFNAYNPQRVIVPIDKLINLHSQKGTRLKQVDPRTKQEEREEFNLTHLITKPLLNNYGS